MLDPMDRIRLVEESEREQARALDGSDYSCAMGRLTSASSAT